MSEITDMFSRQVVVDDNYFENGSDFQITLSSENRREEAA